jgi:3-hydroxybutyryl-CoA dehydrogenase
MKIAVLADELTKTEFLQKQVPDTVEILWCGSVKTLVATVADAYIDLLFVPDPERTKHLAQRSSFPFLVNAVEYTTAKTGNYFIRINAWPGFLQRNIVEVAVAGPQFEPMAKTVFNALQWNYKIVADIPGMITPRIIAAIVNEAWFTYGDGISTKEEIDIAMKAGTSYPYGPFEWGEKIGVERIYTLLKELSVTDDRYSVAPALEKEIKQKHVQ